MALKKEFIHIRQVKDDAKEKSFLELLRILKTKRLDNQQPNIRYTIRLTK